MTHTGAVETVAAPARPDTGLPASARPDTGLPASARPDTGPRAVPDLGQPALSREETAALVTDLLDGPVEPATLDLFWSASRGDGMLLRAFVLAGLALDALTWSEAGWRWARTPGAEPVDPAPAAEPPIRLTPRQHDVLTLLSLGMTADAIARRLGLSPRTVTKHQEKLYRRLGTSDRLTTVLRAQRLGIVAIAPSTVDE